MPGVRRRLPVHRWCLIEMQHRTAAMSISVIIQAFNEEDYIGSTLASLTWALAHLRERETVSVEIIVVDNMFRRRKQAWHGWYEAGPR